MAFEILLAKKKKKIRQRNATQTCHICSKYNSKNKETLSLFLSVQVDAIEYYRAKEKNLLEEMRTQVETVPERPLGIAFVTLQNVAMAKL